MTMKYSLGRFEKKLGIAGVVILVLLIGILLQNKDKKISISSAEIQGVSDEFVVGDNLETETAEGIDDEIPRNDDHESSEREKVKTIDRKSGFYDVLKVIDGDTIVVDIRGKKETLRLIGIDAPEIGGSSLNKKCFGKEAEEFAKKILSGASVGLENDETQDERDKYVRLLRYVILKDGSNFNKMMIREGLAKEYTYKTPYKYQKEFKNAENEARKAKKGLWSECGDDNNHNSGGDEDRNSNNSLSSAPILGTSDCYCESNKYNCSDFKTHAEAQSIFKCCMKKIGGDIHRLDGNNDSQVCENLP